MQIQEANYSIGIGLTIYSTCSYHCMGGAGLFLVAGTVSQL